MKITPTRLAVVAALLAATLVACDGSRSACAQERPVPPAPRPAAPPRPAVKQPAQQGRQPARHHQGDVDVPDAPEGRAGDDCDTTGRGQGGRR